MSGKCFFSALKKVAYLAFSMCIKDKPALVFDLDNTLVYSTELETKSYDFTDFVGNKKYYVHIRPDTCQILEELREYYDIYFFTASSQAYSEFIIGKIAPFVGSDHCFYKNSCIFKYGYALKDLSLMKQPIEKVLLVDDIAGSGTLHPNNIIGVKPWNGEASDRVLQDDLLPLLLKCSEEKNQQTALKKWASKLSVKNLTFLNQESDN